MKARASSGTHGHRRSPKKAKSPTINNKIRLAIPCWILHTWPSRFVRAGKKLPSPNRPYTSWSSKNGLAGQFVLEVKLVDLSKGWNSQHIHALRALSHGSYMSLLVARGPQSQ